jgi:hypothetical protein
VQSRKGVKAYIYARKMQTESRSNRKIRKKEIKDRISESLNLVFLPLAIRPTKAY